MRCPFFRLAMVPLCLAVMASAGGEEIPYRRASGVEEAVERIEKLGGSVRYLTAKRESLEVDFQFAGKRIQDEHLKYLRHLDNVVTLRLKQTGISDRGLSRIRKITTLRRLFLDQTAITDGGLKNLAQLPELDFLSLYGTAVSDEGLQALSEAASLKQLHVAGTAVSEEGIASLQAVHPQLHVIPDPVVHREQARAFLVAATKLLADAEQQMAEAEREFKELGARKDELKKAADEAGKRAEEMKSRADELQKQRDAAVTLVRERKGQSEEAEKAARDKPDDEPLRRLAGEKKKALAEAEGHAGEATAAYDESRTQADAARAEAEKAKSLSARAAKAVEIHGLSKKVLEASRLRLEYARRDAESE